MFTEGTQQRRGESTLTAALRVIDANTPVDQQLRGEVLTDLGDWYLVSNAPRRAYDTYADAWKSLAQVNGTKYLEAPRMLALPSVDQLDRSLAARPGRGGAQEWWKCISRWIATGASTT